MWVHWLESLDDQTSRRVLAGCTGTTAGQDLNLSMDRVVGSRNLTNKLWNAGKFLQMALAQAPPSGLAALAAADFSRPNALAGLPLTERWMLSSLHQVPILRLEMFPQESGLPTCCQCSRASASLHDVGERLQVDKRGCSFKFTCSHCIAAPSWNADSGTLPSGPCS